LQLVCFQGFGITRYAFNRDTVTKEEIMKKRSETISGLMLIILLLLPLNAHAQATDVESVLKTREAALVGRDLDAILVLFADEAIVVTSSGRLLIGKEQIRVWVQDQVDRQQHEEAGHRQMQGNKLSWPGKVYRDDWQKLGVSPLTVTQDAIIESGKIKFFSTTFIIPCLK
jgi:hypothetical protein